MRYVALIAVVACGGSDDMHVTTTFTITEQGGVGPSSLDVLTGQTVTLELDMTDVTHGYGESTGCRSTSIGKGDPTRAGTPEVMQTQVLDMLPTWIVTLELCDVAERSSMVIDSVIDPLNFTVGCLTLPTSAIVYDGNHPKLTSFVGTECSATILDVVFNRYLMAHDFAVEFAAN